MRTIQSKITLTYIIISVVVVTLLGVLLDYEIERYFFDRLLSQLQTETSVVYELLKASVVRGEPRSRGVTDLHAMSSATKFRITLIDDQGTILYESWLADSLLPTLENHLYRPEIIEARNQGIGSNRRHSASVNEDLVYVARWIDGAPFRGSALPNLQYIRVAVSLKDVNEVISEIRWKIAGAALIVLMVIAIASQWLARTISKPIVAISTIVQDIKAGNLDRKLPVTTQDEIGKLAELLNEMTDKLKADIEQLKKLERVRSEFLGNVSHELRTPIFSMKGFLETLIEGAIDDSKVNRKFVEKAYQHATRLDTLLTDLIEISRIQSGEMKMSFRYFELRSFLTMLLEDFTDEAEKKHQHLNLEMPEGEVSVFGDKERLRQAVGNIIDNAIKYSPEQTTILVRAVEHTQSVAISVIDNGPGIASEHLPRIFERFYRVDKNRSREVGGTGLGLAIVKHIIEAHGSKISVTSTVGSETTFSFELKK